MGGAIKKKQEQAAKYFEEFTGHLAESVDIVDLPSYTVGYKLGTMLGVMYEATRDGETQHYLHEFKPEARPYLVASHDNQQLIIAGGDYRITDRGIEDNA